MVLMGDYKQGGELRQDSGMSMSTLRVNVALERCQQERIISHWLIDT